MAPEVSIVVPVFNEAENVGILASEIRCAMAQGVWTWELVFVDDGSTDQSPGRLRDIAEADPNVRLIDLGRNRGQSAALAAGFRAARGDIVATLDADLQNDPADLPSVLAELSDCDAVSGVRRDRHDSWLRRFSSRVANGVRSRVVHDSISDVGCSLKAYRRDALMRVPMFDGAHRFLPALVKTAGGRVKEVEVSHRPRIHGESKYNIRNRLFRGLVDLAGVRWMQSRWIDGEAGREVEGSQPTATPAASEEARRN